MKLVSLNIAIDVAKKHQAPALVISYPDGTAAALLLTEPPTLQQLQAAVEGYIEAANPVPNPYMAFCNEEGKLRGMAPNRYATQFLGITGDILCGPVAILVGVEVDSEGDFVATNPGGEA